MADYANAKEWQFQYSRLKAHVQKYGTYLVKREKYEDLHLWLKRQREAWRTGRLQEERVKLLVKLGVPAASSKHNKWLQKYKKLEQLHDLYGSLDVPEDEYDKELLTWFKHQRECWAQDKLTKKEMKLLKKLGIQKPHLQQPLEGQTLGVQVPSKKMPERYEEKWNKNFEALAEYKQLNGNLPVDTTKQAGVGGWLWKQKDDFRKGTILARRAKLLIDLGYNPPAEDEEVWIVTFRQIKALAKDDCSLATNDSYLSNWSNLQRVLKNSNLLSDTRIRKLDKYDFSWDLPAELAVAQAPTAKAAGIAADSNMKDKQNDIKNQGVIAVAATKKKKRKHAAVRDNSEIGPSKKNKTSFFSEPWWPPKEQTDYSSMTRRQLETKLSARDKEIAYLEQQLQEATNSGTKDSSNTRRDANTPITSEEAQEYISVQKKMNEQQALWAKELQQQNAMLASIVKATCDKTGLDSIEKPALVQAQGALPPAWIDKLQDQNELLLTLIRQHNPDFCLPFAEWEAPVHMSDDLSLIHI